MNLAQAMARNPQGHELHFVLSGLLTEGIADLYDRLRGLVSRDRIHLFDVPGPVLEAHPENRFRARAAELIRENFIFGLNPDVVHVSSLMEGFGDNVTVSIGRLLPGTSTSVTLYDLIPLLEQELYLTEDGITRHYLGKLDDMRNAGLLLAISEYSRREAIETLGIPDAMVVNVSSAADNRFRPTRIAPEQADVIKRKYGITAKFLMYVGAFDPRKNHASLIRAFADLPAAARSGVQLLIVGKGRESVYSDLAEVGRNAGLSPKDVIFSGKVSDDDLVILYNLCHLFVFPSLREGFGLPVLEAISCGTPAIASRTTSIPEVLENEEALFDPADITSISRKLHQGITDQGFREFLSSRGLEQSRKFSWDNSARKALAALEALHDRVTGGTAGKPIRPRKTDALVRGLSLLPESAAATERDLMLIARSIDFTVRYHDKVMRGVKDRDPHVGLITTWNTRCGIATYSGHLVRYIPGKVSILAPYDEELEATDANTVYRCWSTGESAGLSDLAGYTNYLDLDVLVIQFNYGLFDFSRFSDFLSGQISSGRKAVVILHSTADTGQSLPGKRLELLVPALSRCQRLLVHSHNDVTRLRAIGLNNFEFFPLGVPDYRPSLKEKNGKTFVLATYGFFLPHKGLLEIIDTVSLLLRDGIDVRLIMVNAEYPVPESGNLISEAKRRVSFHGLEESVELSTGFLRDEESLSLLSDADLIVFPYQFSGESVSGAVRYGIVSERPVAVTPLPIFDDVRPAVFYLPGSSPEQMKEGIAKLIRDIAHTETYVAEKMESAAVWRESHRYSRVGKRLFEIISAISTNAV